MIKFIGLVLSLGMGFCVYHIWKTNEAYVMALLTAYIVNTWLNTK
jgi:hypothetical protein